MSQFNNGSNFLLDRDSVILLEYEDCEKKLREIGISTLYTKVLFVEGEQEIEWLTPLCEQNNIKIEKVGNCSRLIEIYNGIKEVEQHIQNLHFVFLLDRDVTNDESVQSFIENDEFILLDRHEIENYLLDIDVWAKAAGNLASDPGSITNEWVESVLKGVADQQLETLKALFLNNKIRNDILDYHIKVRHRDIPVDSEDNYSNYIDELFRPEKIDSIKQNALQRYNEVEQKYNQDTWANNWISLCPGKQVVNIASKEVGKQIGVTQGRFKIELFKVATSTQTSSFNQLLNQIKSKLQIQ